MSKSIWILECSSDEGKTWHVPKGAQGYFLFEKTAKAKAVSTTEWHKTRVSKDAKTFGCIYRAVEFRRA